MKRELKFRGWNFTQRLMIEDANHLLPFYNENLPGDKVDLMQFTGLKDKNGREIYEGDIMMLDDLVVPVTWHDAAFHIMTSKTQGASVFVQDRARKFEVIGNIYENPELINPKL